MNLSENGKLLAKLRKSRQMTQKDVAKILGVVPKTVSKWETGNGFPDVSLVSKLAEIYGVSTETILSGKLNYNASESGNMKRTKFYVCSHCGSVINGTGKFSVICCGKQLINLPLNENPNECDINVCEIDGDFYVKINHEMTKEHYIAFVSYVAYDRVLTVRLYPEQDCCVRFPIMHGGKLYYYCTRHGLFEYGFLKNQDGRKQTGINGMSVAYSKKRFCEESLKTAIKTGTEQYVILGDGEFTLFSDCEAKNLSVLKIDMAEFIKDKKDFNDLKAYLKQEGYDESKKTLFSCFGLFFFFTEKQISDLLKILSSICCDGSSAIFDFYDSHTFSTGSADIKNMISTNNKDGRNIKSCFGYAEIESLLSKYGFLIYEFLNSSEICKRYSDKTKMPPVEHINFSLAVYKE